MKEIVVIGGGGHAKVLIGTLNKLPEYSVIGYTDRKDNGSLIGARYLGDDSILNELLKNHPSCCAAIGVGAVAATHVRKTILEGIEKMGFTLPSIVSPFAIVNEAVSLGKATVVFDGAVINPDSEIGEGGIINTNSTVEHDCRIGAYVHIASGATLAGGVQVGEYSLIGAGATIRQSVKICADCTIGAGAVVISDCLQPGIYYGVPARMKI